MSNTLAALDSIEEHSNYVSGDRLADEVLAVVVPLLVAVARAADKLRRWRGVDIDLLSSSDYKVYKADRVAQDDALAAVERYATENLP